MIIDCDGHTTGATGYVLDTVHQILVWKPTIETFWENLSTGDFTSVFVWAYQRKVQDERTNGPDSQD